MEQEQQQHQWTLNNHIPEEEEEEESVLERKKIVQQNNDTLITGVVVSSSSSSASSSFSSSCSVGNGFEHSNGVDTVVKVNDPDGSIVQKEEEHSNGVDTVVKVNGPDGSIVQKEEEHAEMVSVGENGNHFDNDKEDFVAVGLGIVAEFVEAETNCEAETGAILSDADSEKNKNSVYFDKQQGLWKCHHCTWTKRFDGPWTVPIKTMIQHSPCFVCEIKGNEVNGVQNGGSAGSVLPTNLREREFDVTVQDAVISNGLCTEVNKECMETVNDKVPSSSESSLLHNSSNIQATSVTSFRYETSAKERPKIITEIDHQLKEYDVETVLAKQETHDLICPNCKSCITKRVILKKRKRTSHNVEDKSKPDKLVAVDRPKVVDSSAQEASQGDHENVTPDNVSLEQPDDNNNDLGRGPDVFRCLECFSLFIPSGNCFNLFRNVGGARQNEASQNSSSIPASNSQNTSNVQGSNANWFFSIFTLNKGKTAIKQGDSSHEHSRNDSAEQHHSTPISSNMQTSPEIGHSDDSLADKTTVKNERLAPCADHGNGGKNSVNSSTMEVVKINPQTENDIKSNTASGSKQLTDQKYPDTSIQNDLSAIQASTNAAGDVKIIEREKKNDSADTSKTSNVEDMPSTSFSDDMRFKHENVPLETVANTETLFNVEEPAKCSILNPYGKPESRVPTMVESPILDKLPNGVVVDKTPETIQKSNSSLKQGTQSPAQSFGNGVLASDIASNKPSPGIDVIIPSKTLVQKDKKDIEEEINTPDRKENDGGDVIVVVEEEEVDTTSQIGHSVPDEGATVLTGSQTQTSIGEKLTTEVGEPKEWEILKSIVYGGLVESVTSLGIVASAAGSGTAPLNIIALGLANLIGGLFILAHNLSDLRNDHSMQDQQPTKDRYQEVLGRRSNFMLHAVIAVMSFIIFGSIPIIIYGILINKNYYAEVKLATIAATSVFCIILLAIGKVYTTRPPKSYMKTVLYYVTLALAASGVSYIGGNLIKDLLEKFNQSESGSAITMPISDTNMKPTWMSY